MTKLDETSLDLVLRAFGLQDNEALRRSSRAAAIASVPYVYSIYQVRAQEEHVDVVSIRAGGGIELLARFPRSAQEPCRGYDSLIPRAPYPLFEPLAPTRRRVAPADDPDAWRRAEQSRILDERHAADAAVRLLGEVWGRGYMDLTAPYFGTMRRGHPPLDKVGSLVIRAGAVPWAGLAPFRVTLSADGLVDAHPEDAVVRRLSGQGETPFLEGEVIARIGLEAAGEVLREAVRSAVFDSARETALIDLVRLAAIEAAGDIGRRSIEAMLEVGWSCDAAFDWLRAGGDSKVASRRRQAARAHPAVEHVIAAGGTVLHALTAAIDAERSPYSDFAAALETSASVARSLLSVPAEAAGFLRDLKRGERTSAFRSNAPEKIIKVLENTPPDLWPGRGDSGDPRMEWYAITQFCRSLPANYLAHVARNGTPPWRGAHALSATDDRTQELTDALNAFSEWVFRPLGLRPLDVGWLGESEDDMMPQLLSAAVGPRGHSAMLKISAAWHRRAPAMEAARLGVAEAWGDGREWPPLSPPFVAPNGMRVLFLTSRNALAAEGGRLEHCVGGYAPRCLTGSSHIISIRDENGASLSTAELVVSWPSAMGRPAVTVRQHRSHKNAAPTTECERALQAWTEAWQSGDHHINAGECRDWAEGKGARYASLKPSMFVDMDAAARAFELWRFFLPGADRGLAFAEWREKYNLQPAEPAEEDLRIWGEFEREMEANPELRAEMERLLAGFR